MFCAFATRTSQNELETYAENRFNLRKWRPPWHKNAEQLIQLVMALCALIQNSYLYIYVLTCIPVIEYVTKVRYQYTINAQYTSKGKAHENLSNFTSRNPGSEACTQHYPTMARPQLHRRGRFPLHRAPYNTTFQ